MGEIVLSTPDGVDDVTVNTIWTPTEVEYIQSWVVPGKIGETGGRAVKHEFKLTYMGLEEYFGVLSTEEEDESLIEDMAAGLAERLAVEIVIKVQARSGKFISTDLAKKVNVSIRRDVAGAIRDMRSHSKKRRESTNGRIYYAGLH